MSTQLAISELYEQLKHRLDIQWLAGRNAGDSYLDDARSGDIGLVGHLNLIHANQIQLIGYREAQYLKQLSADARKKKIEHLFLGQVAILVLAEHVEPFEQLEQRCDEAQVALFRSSLKTYELLSEIQFFLAQELAEQVVLHGVFLEVAGIGLLLTGESAIGKSELALELVTRGNRLIADDAPIFSRISPTTLSGESPELLQDFLEVRGLGILNIRAMFGDASIKQRKYLRMVVNLVPMSDAHFNEGNRLEGLSNEKEILGIKVPEITIPVAPGRDLAILVEAAARNQILKTNGYSAADDFRGRLNNQIQSQTKE